MAVLSSSYNVESSAKTTLKNSISPTLTVGIQLNYALTITSGVLIFDRDTTREEFISFGGVSISGGISTLSDVTRNLTRTLNDFSGTGTGSNHSGGVCIVELTNYHALYNLKANTDRSNSFSADQTIAGTKKWFFNDSDSYIYDNGTDLVFKSTAQAERSLSQLASLSGSNDKTKVSSADTTEGYLNTKLNLDQGLIAVITNPAGNEVLKIDIDLATDPGLEFSSNQIRVKVKAAGGIVRDSNGLSFDQAASFSPTGTWDMTGATMTNFEAITIKDLGLLGENVTANQVLCVNGDEMMYLAQADVLNDCFTAVGTAREAGSAAETKKINMFGPVVAVSGLTATSGRLWTGQTQTSSNTAAAVYGVIWEGMTFTPTAGQKRIDQIDLHLTKVGTPTGTYTIHIRATDGSGLATGADLATATLAVGSMATGLNRFTGVNLAVTPLTKYAIILSNTSATVTDNYTWSLQNTDVYATGNRISSADSGGTWSPQASQDFRFTVYYNAVACSDVYLSDTEGTPTLSPGTYHHKIGKAITDAKMLLAMGAPSLYATYTFSSSSSDVNVDTEISTGFRVKALIAYAVIGVHQCTGWWHHGLSGGVGWGHAFAGTTINVTQNSAYFAEGHSAATAVSDFTKLKVQSVGPDSITIRREMNDDTADAPGGTVYLMLFG